LLRQLGHDVLDVKELKRFGLKDAEVYHIFLSATARHLHNR
jgi:hypothetical protein